MIRSIESHEDIIFGIEIRSPITLKFPNNSNNLKKL